MGKHSGNRKKYTAQEVIDAIPGSAGIISTIAKRLGCTWPTAKGYIDTMPTVQAAYRAECESVTDLAESVVIKSIHGGNVGDAKWWLTKRGVDRGFGDRQAVDVTTDEGLTVIIRRRDED